MKYYKRVTVSGEKKEKLVHAIFSVQTYRGLIKGFHDSQLLNLNALHLIAHFCTHFSQKTRGHCLIPLTFKVIIITIFAVSFIISAHAIIFIVDNQMYHKHQEFFYLPSKENFSYSFIHLFLFQERL